MALRNQYTAWWSNLDCAARRFSKHVGLSAPNQRSLFMAGRLWTSIDPSRTEYRLGRWSLIIHLTTPGFVNHAYPKTIAWSHASSSQEDFQSSSGFSKNSTSYVEGHWPLVMQSYESQKILCESASLNRADNRIGESNFHPAGVLGQHAVFILTSVWCDCIGPLCACRLSERLAQS